MDSLVDNTAVINSQENRKINTFSNNKFSNSKYQSRCATNYTLLSNVNDEHNTAFPHNKNIKTNKINVL